jgi:hypothetical protein
MQKLIPERFVVLLALLAVLAVYWRVTDYEFVVFDDGQYVVNNPHVQSGLTKEGVTWALTTTSSSNWHPLTWLSYMLDSELYGLNARGYHLTNLLLHLASTGLLFLALRRMTGAPGCSGFVAALFALHPLHVESVAWVAERKDVLAGFFWMLTLCAYARYAEKPFSFGRYILVPLCLILGLMAKPMLVTLPFVLLLLDFWPLDRFGGAGSQRRFDPAQVRRLVLEKLPLFLLAAASSVFTLLIQRSSRATELVEDLTLDLRLWNALLTYVQYIGGFLWPRRLAVFYPHPGDSVLVGLAVAAALLLLGISVLVMRAARRCPYLHDWTRSGRRAVHGGSIHVHSTGRPFDHAGLGHTPHRPELALSDDSASRSGRLGPVRPDRAHMGSARPLEEQRYAV